MKKAIMLATASFLSAGAVRFWNGTGLKAPSVTGPARAVIQREVVYAVDSSGSMAANKQGEKCVRGAKISAGLLTGLLAPGDRVALMEFAGAPRTLHSTTVQEEYQGAELDKAADLIEFKGYWTNIEGVLLSALSWFQEAKTPAPRRVLNLFSDGVIDLPDDRLEKPSRDRILTEVVERFKQSRIVINSICITNCDRELMATLAESTGGKIQVLDNKGDLVGAMVGVTGDALDLQPVAKGSLELKGTQPAIFEFAVDEQAEKLVLLISFSAPPRDESKRSVGKAVRTELIARGRPVPDHDVIATDLTTGDRKTTVNRPAPGPWKVIITPSRPGVKVKLQYRVFVKSPYRLRAQAASSVPFGQPLAVEVEMVKNGGGTIDPAGFYRKGFAFEVALEHGAATSVKALDNGRGADKKAGDHVYTAAIPSPRVPGRYSIAARFVPFQEETRRYASQIRYLPFDALPGFSVTPDYQHLGRLKRRSLVKLPIQVAANVPVRIGVSADADVLCDGKRPETLPTVSPAFIQAGAGEEAARELSLSIPRKFPAGDCSVRLDFASPKPASAGQASVTRPVRLGFHVLSFFEIWRGPFLVALIVMFLVICAYSWALRRVAVPVGVLARHSGIPRRLSSMVNSWSLSRNAIQLGGGRGLGMTAKRRSEAQILLTFARQNGSVTGSYRVLDPAVAAGRMSEDGEANFHGLREGKLENGTVFRAGDDEVVYRA